MFRRVRLFQRVVYCTDCSDGYRGVFITCRESLISCNLEIENNNCELVAYEIKPQNNGSLIVCSAYRSTSSSVDYLNQLCAHLETIKSNHSHLVIRRSQSPWHQLGGWLYWWTSVIRMTVVTLRTFLQLKAVDFQTHNYITIIYNEDHVHYSLQRVVSFFHSEQQNSVALVLSSQRLCYRNILFIWLQLLYNRSSARTSACVMSCCILYKQSTQN